METRVDEVADGIHRFSFNQFIVKAYEPLLFHCGQRQGSVPLSLGFEVLRRPGM